MMKILLIILLLPFAVISQTNWEPVEAREFLELIREYEQSIPTGTSYSLETVYTIFNDHRDTEPVMSFDGKLTCRNGKELNISQNGQLAIQDASLNVTIDTSARQLLVQHADPTFFYRKTLGDYQSFLEMTDAVSKKTSNGSTFYLMRLKKGNPYHSMEFMFEDRTVISRIIIYSNQPYYVEENGPMSGNAKIVLDFKKMKHGKAAVSSDFLTIKDCIVVTDKQITPSGKYKDFEVIDLRN